MALCPVLSDDQDVGDPAETSVRAGLPAVVVPAVAVALAAVLLAGLFFAARPGTASAATVLQRGEGVVAQLPGGGSQRLAVGDEVPRGALVVAARDGAVLRTLDRDTWLGGGSAVTVLDGGRQELREGLVMVDARRGPALALTTAAADVTVPEGAVSRVEAGPLVRVGSYAGDPLTVQPAGRRATTPVARDYQVQVPRGALPGRVTPLVLTPGDAYERALAPLLVAADTALNDVAEQLDAGGTPARVVRAAADTDVPPSAVPAAAVPAGAPGSERALAYLLARTAPDGRLPDRYARVRALRGDGGSWGVVADLVAADVPRVAGLLDELLAPDDAVLAAEPLDAPSLVELVTGGTGAGAAPSSGSAAPSAPAPGPGAPAPPPAPAPPVEPLPPAPDPQTLIGTLVDTVVALLPTGDSSAPTAPAAEPVPAPSPAPLLPLLTP